MADKKYIADRKYVQSKIDHMKRTGTNAGLSEKGAAQPDWAKNEADERYERYKRLKKRRKWGKEYHDEYET